MDTDSMKESGKAMMQNAGEKAQNMADRIGSKAQSLVDETQAREPDAHKEGPVARFIESQTARLPSDVFLWSALAAIGVSAAFQLRGRSNAATFIGHWAPTFLVLGLYNKIVKVAGSDRLDPSRGLVGDSSLSGKNDETSAALH